MHPLRQGPWPRQFKIVLAIIKRLLKAGETDKWNKIASRCKGVSEETTTGVTRSAVGIAALGAPTFFAAAAVALSDGEVLHCRRKDAVRVWRCRCRRTISYGLVVCLRCRLQSGRKRNGLHRWGGRPSLLHRRLAIAFQFSQCGEMTLSIRRCIVNCHFSLPVNC